MNKKGFYMRSKLDVFIYTLLATMTLCVTGYLQYLVITWDGLPGKVFLSIVIFMVGIGQSLVYFFKPFSKTE